MKKKGFTLIELLAVIVILAVIALIATPAVLNIIEDSKKAAAEASARNVVSAAKTYYLQNIMDNINTDKIDLSNSPFTYDGDKASKGYLKYDKEGNAYGKMYISGYCIEISANGTINSNKESEKNCTFEEVKEDVKEETTDNYIELNKDVTDLTNTTWILDDTGYKFSTVSTYNDGFTSQANKLIDLSDANLTFTSNGKKYIGITSLYLPFDAPLPMDLQISAFGITAGFTSGAFDKIDFPFGSTIKANKGVILYAIDKENGFYAPYYEENNWYNSKHKILTITGGDDVKNAVVIKWFKNHGKRIELK
ncbi:MAG: prepilin-type N-terminal cleavage/methylation domain-containing protein [Bacillales bacterium]|nr:prepilin-type N-terminal cleavage/methylation domain-containing protein [Bacillales bacterium]